MPLHRLGYHALCDILLRIYHMHRMQRLFKSLMYSNCIIIDCYYQNCCWLQCFIPICLHLLIEYVHQWYWQSTISMSDIHIIFIRRRHEIITPCIDSRVMLNLSELLHHMYYQLRTASHCANHSVMAHLSNTKLPLVVSCDTASLFLAGTVLI